MYSLNHFSLASMVLCCERIRELVSKCNDFEQAADKIVEFFHTHFTREPNSQPACPLVRFYRTIPLAGLPMELQVLVRDTLKENSFGPGTRFLNLVATRGTLPEWNDPEKSKGHRFIPLLSKNQINQLPMVAQLIRQFGLDPMEVINPGPSILLELEQKSYGVFHVEEALGSPFIPRQDDFVVPYGIRSVLGMGGILPTGDLFAILLFSTLTIPRETADLFKTIALNIKLALLPFVKKFLNQQDTLADAVIRIRESRVNTLAQLLQVFEKTVLEQFQALESAHQSHLNQNR